MSEIDHPRFNLQRHDSLIQADYAWAREVVRCFSASPLTPETAYSDFLHIKEALVVILQTIGDIQRDPKTQEPIVYTHSFGSVHMSYTKTKPTHQADINFGAFGTIHIIQSPDPIDWRKLNIRNGLFMTIPVATEHRPCKPLEIAQIWMGRYKEGKAAVIRPYESDDQMLLFVRELKDVLQDCWGSLPSEVPVSNPYPDIYPCRNDN